MHGEEEGENAQPRKHVKVRCFNGGAWLGVCVRAEVSIALDIYIYIHV